MSPKLPKGWEKLELGAFCTEHRRRAKSDDLPIFSVSKDYGLIAQAELFDRRIASADTSNYKTLKRGEYAYDPMLLWTGSIGCLWRAEEVMISPAYTTFGIDERTLLPKFFDTLIKMPRMIERYRSISHGTNVRRKKARFDDFAALVIDVPPYQEQCAIAATLNGIEEAIVATEALTAALVDAKHATMRELLTRGIRREKAPMKPLPSRWVLGRIAEGITDIPADWDLVTLTKVAKLESGHTPDRKEPAYWNGSIPWISLQDADALTKVTISQTAETIGPLGLANSSARMLPAGTVVLQRTANVGLASVMGREMCTSQHFANWICGSKLDPYYLQQIFRHMSREWQRLVAGSVLPDIYMGTFKALQILLPPLTEQKKIGEVGAAFDLRIEEERNTLTTLIENRKALAQELLSGRTRLPESIIALYRDKAGQAA